ncbi:M16 family metallopeptidase [Pararhodonellum marinum]|uniref:M16 family metallopeptidase n=1 Tax=Pararhodonellum marinum TaxID=2755358 RepID=UPI001E4C6FA1|nr:pitrilysin family protein [Pararhodonellum marinum]
MPDRSKAPEFQIPDHIDLIQPRKWTLKNGIPLYYIQTDTIEAVKLEVIFQTPLKKIPEGKGLVPFFTLHMLLEGTHNLPSEELDNFFDHYASEVEFISSFEQHGLSLLCTAKHFKDVLPVFRSLFTEAVFPKKELDTRKAQKKLSIALQLDKNPARANQLIRKALFGSDHPFGFIAREEDVDEVSVEDLKTFYQDNFLNRPELFLTGPLGDDQVTEIMKAFEDLPNLAAPIHLLDYQFNPNEKITETRAKSVQSTIRIGQHLISKKHPDHHGLMVFNTILGGYFGSRLIRNIREDKGHTYGIYSSIGSLNPTDYWLVMADVQKGFAEEVIEEVYKEIDRLKSEAVSHDELETVRNYMIGHFLSSFSSPFDLISRFKSIHQHGLDYSFYEEQLQYIRKFTPEDVLRIGQQYFKENFIEVVVG